VEHHDGRWEIITWTHETDHVDVDTDSDAHKQSTGHTSPGADSIRQPGLM
jgi:hypothetical protein